MITPKLALVTLAAGGLVLAGCGSSTPSVSRDNVAYMYGRGGEQIRLETRVYHHAPERSTL